ncbi:hypothetical protein LguiB_005184 [Lonicera macranthoides]
MANPIFCLTLTCLIFFYSSTLYSKPLEKHRASPKFKNIIDSCWRSDPNWASHRKALAKCAKGFGSNATGGEHGLIYVVTDPSDDPEFPKRGTLRYGVIQSKPLWIIFKRDMVLTFKNKLLVNSFKTIDGRGVKVEIVNGPCINLNSVRYVIIHGIQIRQCKTALVNGLVSTSPHHVERRIGSGGDAITIFGSSNIWIDHCSLTRCTDGLIDITHGSTNVTISNNHFSHHVKVMLLGHQDGFTDDKIMKVTIAYNHFGRGLGERMPRVRYGYVHVANNKYDKWKLYAIGGSSEPTILSEGNFYVAPDNVTHKEVTKRENHVGEGTWKKWKWKSSKDVFRNGARFAESGFGNTSPLYSCSQSFDVADGLFAPSFTSNAGALHCLAGKLC